MGATDTGKNVSWGVVLGLAGLFFLVLGMAFFRAPVVWITGAVLMALGAVIQSVGDRRKTAAESPATPNSSNLNPSAPSPSPSPAFSPHDPVVQLERLKSMHEAGLITDDEYDAKKAEIIERL